MLLVHMYNRVYYLGLKVLTRLGYFIGIMFEYF